MRRRQRLAEAPPHPDPLPARGYSIHTSQNPILRQWVTRTHPLGQPRTPDPSQGIRKTHVFPLRISTERIKSVHSTAARGERERRRCAHLTCNSPVPCRGGSRDRASI